MISVKTESRNCEVIAEQARILLAHTAADGAIDYEFVRIHALMIYQCVADHDAVERLLAADDIF